MRRVAYAFIALIFLIEGISYVRYMEQPSSVPFGPRSVEWVRANVSSWLVDEIEREYYSWNAPAKGGPTIKALPAVGMGTVNLGQVAASQAPPSITPLIQPALPGEGVWRTTGLNVGGSPPVLVTTFRSDPVYPRMVAGVAWIDQRKARVMLVPGPLRAAGQRAPRADGGAARAAQPAAGHLQLGLPRWKTATAASTPTGTSGRPWSTAWRRRWAIRTAS